MDIESENERDVEEKHIKRNNIVKNDNEGNRKEFKKIDNEEVKSVESMYTIVTNG